MTNPTFAVYTKSGTITANQFSQVVVVTGAAAASQQPGAMVGSTSATQAITPTANGSLIYGFTYSGAENGGQTVSSNVTEIGSNGGYGIAFVSNSTTTAGSSVVLGGATNGKTQGIVAAEILAASGGPGIAQDASTPAYSTGYYTATTAPFQPPLGSLLVLMIAANGLSASPECPSGVYDTSGLGLTWTQLPTTDLYSGGVLLSIWLAEMPSVLPSGFTTTFTTQSGDYCFCQIIGFTGATEVPGAGSAGANGALTLQGTSTNPQVTVGTCNQAPQGETLECLLPGSDLYDGTYYGFMAVSTAETGIQGDYGVEYGIVGGTNVTLANVITPVAGSDNGSITTVPISPPGGTLLVLGFNSDGNHTPTIESSNGQAWTAVPNWAGFYTAMTPLIVTPSAVTATATLPTPTVATPAGTTTPFDSQTGYNAVDTYFSVAPKNKLPTVADTISRLWPTSSDSDNVPFVNQTGFSAVDTYSSNSPNNPGPTLAETYSRQWPTVG